MINPKLFPTILIGFQMLTAIIYATHGDWRKVTYWIAASILIASITF